MWRLNSDCLLSDTDMNCLSLSSKEASAGGSVSCGGESGPVARICDYGWVLDTHMQCVEYGVPFSFHQTGARLRRGTKIYEIPREHQHEQAHKAHLDYNGVTLPVWDYLTE